MAINPDDSEYGGQTVTGAAWPQVNEDTLASAAASFESLKSHLRDVVIPTARNQMMKLSDSWEGTGSQAALDEASAIIDKHEANATAAEDDRGPASEYGSLGRQDQERRKQDRGGCPE